MSDHAAKPRRPRIVPRIAVHLLIIMVVVSWIPFALIALKRNSLSANPPIHIFQDMDNQPKLKTQAMNPAFLDHRVMQLPVFGTVARGKLNDDDHLYRGYVTDPTTGDPVRVAVGDTMDNQWIDGYPVGIEITEAFLRRGQQRFDIFCSPCHGMSGRGTGMVHRRALSTGSVAKGWTTPSNIVTVDADGVSTYSAAGSVPTPNGRLFHVISRGVLRQTGDQETLTMPGYASDMSVEDRWAVVAYVRALQLSQNARIEDVPANEQPGLR